MSWFNPRPELEHMTPAELSALKAGRDSGHITFFRVKLCEREGCKVEILKHKRWCSHACAVKAGAIEAPPEVNEDGDD